MNLNRLLLSILTLGLFFYYFPEQMPVFANDEFETSTKVRYEIQPDSRAFVSQEVVLTNKSDRVFATKYSFRFSSGRIENLKAHDEKGPLTFEILKENEATIINLSFNQEVVGRGKQLIFNIEYDLFEYVDKNGQIWEVNIPKLSDEKPIDQYQLTLVVPLSFGKPTFMSPKPSQEKADSASYYFDFNKEQMLNTGISAAFGDFQVFDFVLNYHLENPGLVSADMKIALPPDTVFQKVSYPNIKPAPAGVYRDLDGNWLAEYRLAPQEKINVVVVGKAKIFSSPQTGIIDFSPQTIEKNLLPQRYWEIDDPLIQTAAVSLKNPDDIYQFVVNVLDYDFSRVKEGVERLGAVGALKTPNRAICTEFTDLFIALSRASGIPAREINGYAHTNNDKLMPLNLIADVLHAWPEYWSKDQKIWIPVDPTWGKTTGGIDFFSKTDLNRIVFAIHGLDSQLPYPAGAYRSKETTGKDIQVAFGQYASDDYLAYDVVFELPEEVFYKIADSGMIKIKNSGTNALYNQNFTIKTENLRLVSPEGAEISINSLLPFSEYRVPVEIKTDQWRQATAGIISISNEERVYQSIIKIGSIFDHLVFPIILLLLLASSFFFMIKIKCKYAS